ncbi:hypothetical protein [Ferrigenium sp. UT5]|uniref:hypothetical protein n=1 Tax=Ferrigenium sp. UT5 TaxID=3242105 RepID=UPI00354CDB1E
MGMLLHLRQVNARLPQQGRASIKMGIVLHMGEVISGRIGSAARCEYILIGGAVSLSVKLAALGNAPDWNPPVRAAA